VLIIVAKFSAVPYEITVLQTSNSPVKKRSGCRYVLLTRWIFNMWSFVATLHLRKFGNRSVI